ncbi:hypothetical protein GT347_20390 [Xylophilus rhododendri]|uniref:Uncharacterized protein n=1 Tax=Xylophilus rhododendri TaxID=2697032 RepID=A0A857JAG9_9BURK|nr:hypothetical protein [Xylophilus rhododendri]QHJ00132.1 hypothetical protein GT347_20390 [Xylophilus rhododendri]
MTTEINSENLPVFNSLQSELREMNVSSVIAGKTVHFQLVADEISYKTTSIHINNYFIFLVTTASLKDSKNRLDLISLVNEINVRLPMCNFEIFNDLVRLRTAVPYFEGKINKQELINHITWMRFSITKYATTIAALRDDLITIDQAIAKTTAPTS